MSVHFLSLSFESSTVLIQSNQYCIFQSKSTNLSSLSILFQNICVYILSCWVFVDICCSKIFIDKMWIRYHGYLYQTSHRNKPSEQKFSKFLHLPCMSKMSGKYKKKILKSFFFTVAIRNWLQIFLPTQKKKNQASNNFPRSLAWIERRRRRRRRSFNCSCGATLGTRQLRHFADCDEN